MSTNDAHAVAERHTNSDLPHDHRPVSLSARLRRDHAGFAKLAGEVEQMEAERDQLRVLVERAFPFVAKAYREGGISTFPNAGDWLDLAHAMTTAEYPDRNADSVTPPTDKQGGDAT